MDGDKVCKNCGRGIRRNDPRTGAPEGEWWHLNSGYSPCNLNATPPRGGTLRLMLEAYLLSKGFFRHRGDDGREYWGHHELGTGRTFTQVVSWQMGRDDSEAFGGGLPSIYSGWENGGHGFGVVDPRVAVPA